MQYKIQVSNEGRHNIFREQKPALTQVSLNIALKYIFEHILDTDLITVENSFLPSGTQNFTGKLLKALHSSEFKHWEQIR